jgi:hypothetical protein
MFVQVKDLVGKKNSIAAAVFLLFNPFLNDEIIISSIGCLGLRRKEDCQWQELPKASAHLDTDHLEYMKNNGGLAFGPPGGRRENHQDVVDCMFYETCQEMGQCYDFLDRETLLESPCIFRAKDDTIHTQYDPEVEYACTIAFVNINHLIIRLLINNLPEYFHHYAELKYDMDQEGINGDPSLAYYNGNVNQYKRDIETLAWTTFSINDVFDDLSQGKLPSLTETHEGAITFLLPRGFKEAESRIQRIRNTEYCTEYDLVCLLPKTAITWFKNLDTIKAVVKSVFPKLESDKSLTRKLYSFIEDYNTVFNSTEGVMSMYPHFSKWMKKHREELSDLRLRNEKKSIFDVDLEKKTCCIIVQAMVFRKIIFNGWDDQLSNIDIIHNLNAKFTELIPVQPCELWEHNLEE